MNLFTAQQIKQLDARAVSQYDVPALLLMEHAALAMYRQIAADHPTGSKILIVCGAGNNGGDGLALARLLVENGYKPTVYLLAKADRLTELAAVYYRLLQHCDLAIEQIASAADLEADPAYHLIVDALLGVSLNRPVDGLYGQVIDWINAARCPVLSADLPSGIDASTGHCLGRAVKADQTISFGAAKIGLYLYPAADYVGNLSVAQIGIPAAAFEDLANDLPAGEAIAQLLTPACLTRLAERSANSHKGSFGHALIVAGSKNMAGAALLAAKAAYRSGVGLVSVLTVETNRVALNSYLPEAICYGQDDDCQAARAELTRRAALANALLIGPGLSTDHLAVELVKCALAVAKPLLIDADGLNIIAADRQLLASLKTRTAATVLTPHIGEMSRLTGLTTQQILADPIVVARRFARDHRAIVVLKSARTIIAQPSGQIYINNTGNAGMATAGSGDVLAGIGCGLLSNPRNRAIDAALAAVFLHGRAGARAAQKMSQSAIIAGDLIDCLY